jgi:hypothetical protein
MEDKGKPLRPLLQSLGTQEVYGNVARFHFALKRYVGLKASSFSCFIKMEISREQCRRWGGGNIFLNQSSGFVTVTISGTPVCRSEHDGMLGHEQHEVT